MEQPVKSECTAAYVHLPFCKKKCFYCDFPVEAVGKAVTSDHVQARMSDYVATLVREILATTPAQEHSAPLTSIYFGGGTPSLVPPELISVILKALDSRYGIAADAEISMEADPGTFDAQRLATYRSLGVSRLSMGVQAFNQETLALCGRAHDLRDVYRAIEAVSGSGIRSWSLDLMSGLPRLTLPAWEHSLREGIKAGPTHISVYDLQVEEGTPFDRWYSPGQTPLPPDETAADMYALASNLLGSAGYEHYEVSSYAQPGHRSRHNQVYWSGAPYYAFGVGAASYLGGRRYSRPKTLPAYAKWVQSFVGGGGGTPGLHIPAESQEERLLDSVMLRLRLSDGLDLRPSSPFSQDHTREAAATVWRALQPHLASGKVQLFDEHGFVIQTAAGSQQSKPGTSEVPMHSDSGGSDTGHSRSSSTSSSSSNSSSSSLEGEASPDTSDTSRSSSTGDGGELGSGGVLHGADVTQSQTHSSGAGSLASRATLAGLQSASRSSSLGPIPAGVRLSDPHGFLVSNDIISDVFAAFTLTESTTAA
ncbi:MAG: hypothetical protein WDW38_008300 [Sanguina aurantia]